MKLALDIKNASKAVRPTTDNVIVFDDGSWYITTKQDLLKDAYDLLAECKSQLEKLKTENANFKKDTASQVLELSKIIQSMYEEK